jgi:hypothetical protein
MAHITIEYVIMIPVLVMQIFLFPLAANWLMNIWVDSRRALALQDVASHLGSTVQQLYFSLNHGTISAGTVTYSPRFPVLIEDSVYAASATLRTVLDPAMNSSKVLDLTVRLVSDGRAVTASVVLGPNVQWQASTFFSNSTNACVTATKSSNGNITLGFAG